MKTLKIAILALFATFMLAACGGGSPESVAENMYKAYFNGDFEKAAKYATAESATMLKQMAAMSGDEMGSFKEMMKGAKVKAVGSEIDKEDGTAIVDLELTSPDGEVDNITCHLVKEDGSWKAEFRK